MNPLDIGAIVARTGVGSPRLTGEHLAEVPLGAGLDFAPLRELTDVVGGTVRQRLDRARGLTSPARHQAAAVAQEEVGHIVCAMELVLHGLIRIVSHAAGAVEVDPGSLLEVVRLPGL